MSDTRDPKVLGLAQTFYDTAIKDLVDNALKMMKVGVNKDQKAYFKASRQVFKALAAAAAQRILEEGGNQKLLEDTYSPADAWALFLLRHPDIAAKLAAEKPGVPLAPGEKQKKLGLKLIEGGLPEVATGDEACDCNCHAIPIPGGCSNCSCISEIDGDEGL
jgi:hypothetical protein